MRVLRGRYAHARNGGARLAITRIAGSPFQARVSRKVPGLFVFAAPRWRNRNTRRSQKPVLPGSNPGWGTRFFSRRRMRLRCSFTTWMWQSNPAARHGPQFELRPRGGAAACAGIAQPAELDGASVEVASSTLAACSISSRCSAAGQRASFGTTRPQVRILPARPTHSSVAQQEPEHAATNREAEGSNPSGGANS